MKNFLAFCSVLVLIVSRYFSQAQILFEEHIIRENFKQTMSVYAIDMDNDSDMDVLGAAWQDNTIAWWENNGSQNFSKHLIANNLGLAICVFAIDLDICRQFCHDPDAFAVTQNTRRFIDCFAFTNK